MKKLIKLSALVAFATTAFIGCPGSETVESETAPEEMEEGAEPDDGGDGGAEE